MQALWLQRVMDEYGLVTDVLVDSLSKLVNLKSLRLKEISESFTDRHIEQLTRSLPKLEILSIGGSKLTDAVWGDFATPKSLQRLDLGALTSFTATSILNFIEKLGPGNNGLLVTYPDNRRRILQAERRKIQENIAYKVEGTFEFIFAARD